VNKKRCLDDESGHFCGKMADMKQKNSGYMGKVCDICGKGVQHANVVSHAKNRTHIVRKPNLHHHSMVVEGKKLRLNLCAKCKRGMNVRGK
jgi:ribosomal protein L28